MSGAPSSVIVTSSKALVTSSDALVTSSFLFLLQVLRYPNDSNDHFLFLTFCLDLMFLSLSQGTLTCHKGSDDLFRLAGKGFAQHFRNETKTSLAAKAQLQQLQQIQICSFPPHLLISSFVLIPHNRNLFALE